jgi:hypothetical protein
MSAHKILNVLIIGDTKDKIKKFIAELETYTYFPSNYYGSTIFGDIKDSGKYDLIITISSFYPILNNKNIVVWNPQLSLYSATEKVISGYKYIHQITTFRNLSLLMSKIYLTGNLICKNINGKRKLTINIPEDNFEIRKFIKTTNYEISESELLSVSTPIISTPSGRKSISPDP